MFAGCRLLKVTAMLNLTTANPVSWSPPPSAAVPPVPAVAPVQAMPGAGRDPQAGMGSGRERSAARSQDEKSAPSNGAPLLPRGRAGADPSSAQPAVVEDAQARKAAEEAALARAEERANAKEEIQQRLQDVLSNVWKASAAVVERALGQEGDAGEAAGAGSAAGALPPRRVLLVQPAPSGVAPAPSVEVQRGGTPAAPAAPLPGAGANPADLVAYDERGNGSVQSPEAGSLLSRRV